MVDEVTMCNSLLKWLNTFEGVKAPHSSAEELVDGVALCECLAEIAPDWFDDEWTSKIRKDIGDNRRLRLSNLKKLIRGIHDYYTEVLTMDIAGFPMPDINAIADSADVSELARLLQLILGCAVNCEDKQEYIQVIMQLEETVQHVVMTAIQELMTARDQTQITPEMFKELESQHKRTLEQLTTAMVEKEELSQRCHELDDQITYLRESESTMQIENERLHQQLSQIDMGDRRDSLTTGGTKMRHIHMVSKIDQLKEENFILETARDEYRIKADQLERDVEILNEKNEQLQGLAEESQQLKDEMDVLRHMQEKVSKYESTIDMYKKKLEELSDMRKQMKAMEEKNVTYMQETMNLEEDLKKANALKTQLDTYKKQSMLSKKESEMKAMEERYKRYLEKAKSVIKTLDPKQNAGQSQEAVSARA
ncbi:predicted protein [Nematostella vectensis]|uniref:Calponin-homology (CH) domain-containing protein n=1 Tax=Nematostella vectensis TaxID=45351 RepID=A7SQM2_NEMVE|nr:predicted protein [Nematostella vectensis]|eukprot:XP_001626079.1 predicted protein [Nematostella vectensis]